MEKVKESKDSPLKVVRKVIVALLGIFLVVFVILVIWLIITEYKPEDTEKLDVSGDYSKELKTGENFTVMSWNVGYGALGEYADFFMDGGKSVSCSTREQVNDNLNGIRQGINSVGPDVIMFQEMDVNSKRSQYINEYNYFSDNLEGYNQSFAYNYKVKYVPYPFPTIGKVEAGISTFSKFDVSNAQRQSLPCPFKYPLRLCNLKRCLIVSRIPVQNSDRELVVVNVHLEAYDDGEGKAAQTQQLKKLLREEFDKGNYVIAGGDFNQRFSGIDTSMYPLVSDELWKPGDIDEEEFGNDFEFLMDTKYPSCRSLSEVYLDSDKENFQYYMLDGYIVSSNIQVEKMETRNFDFRNSDHNPIILIAKLK